MPLQPGARLGPYEIVSALGAGGMGEVYKALDTRLDRTVAIKILPEALAADPTFKDRFNREAHAVSRLDHPNICALYDVGEQGGAAFLVMQYLEGETLAQRLKKGALSHEQAVTIAIPIASALGSAHRAGIVHRDLKPANIFLTHDGRVKILDFGLAKATRPVVGGIDVDVTCAPSSTPGLVLGTAGYMAPEQVRGEVVDLRADLFAVGAILYELVTGRRAFQGESLVDTMSAVLRDDPSDLVLRGDTPSGFVRVVRRCLEKDPNRRFQSASDLRFALESMVHANEAESPALKTSDEKSVAVLPFANMSGDTENLYFSDGLAEELINALTRLPGLHVASRTSAFRFRDRDADIRQIGRELRVATVLEGSVRRAGQRLRVTAQLISVADGYHIWSERYDREMADVFDIQDDIVESIVRALAPTLAGEARHAVRRPTENPEAYELYLKGRHAWHQRSPRALQSALRCFEQVIALDADYALAHAGVADCLGICRAYGWFTATQSQGRARDAVTRAMALDSSLAEVQFSQAGYIYFFEPTWRESEPFLKRAVAINPRIVDAYGYLALLLACDRRSEGAADYAARAREIDPLSPVGHYLASLAFIVMQKFDRAEEAARRVLELQPDSLTGLWPLGLALCGLDRGADAVTALERAVVLSRAPTYVGWLGLALARVGRTDDSRRLLLELEDRSSRGEYVAPSARLCIHVGLADFASVRRSLAECVADATPQSTIKFLSCWIQEFYETDPEVTRLWDTLHRGKDHLSP